MKSPQPRTTGRAATTKPPVRHRPEPMCKPAFRCPMCGGEATLIGKSGDREFLCLDCTVFTVNRDD